MIGIVALTVVCFTFQRYVKKIIISENESIRNEKLLFFSQQIFNILQDILKI
jgi:hypothetical protein